MKSITNIFKNKIVVAVICFVIAMIIAFIIVPSKNHDGERVNVIKVTKTISANTKITDDMLKEVNVEYDSVPSEAIRSKSDIVDKYAKSTIYPSDFITQEKAINVTKELRQMYFNFEDKNRVMSISQDIDSCIARNADDYHYDLDSAYDELIENNTAFDIACTMALVVKQHNQVGRDMRYHSDVVEWANDFLQNNDIDFEQFKILPLCHSHAIVLNGFAEMVKERSENNGLSMTINSGMSL